MNNVAHSLLRHIDEMLSYECIIDSERLAARLQSLIAEEASQVALVTIELLFEEKDQERPALPETQVGPVSSILSAEIEASMHYILDGLRRLVRKTDIVYVLDTTCHFLLRGASLDGGYIVHNRLWDALLWRVHNINDNEIARPYRMSIGYAAYPYPATDVYECIEASHEEKQAFEFRFEQRQVTLAGRARSSHAHDLPCEGTPLAASCGESIDNKDGNIHENVQELSMLARTLGIPYLSLLPRKKQTQIQQYVALELLRELRCYPVGRERGTLTIAVSDPHDNTILDRLHRETGMRIFRVLTPLQELQTALDQLL